MQEKKGIDLKTGNGKKIIHVELTEIINKIDNLLLNGDKIEELWMDNRLMGYKINQINVEISCKHSLTFKKTIIIRDIGIVQDIYIYLQTKYANPKYEEQVKILKEFKSYLILDNGD